MKDIMPARPSSQILASNIRRERMARGWTQIVLAERAKMQQSRISEIEGGVYSPTTETIDAIADALGVQPASLLIPVEQVAAN